MDEVGIGTVEIEIELKGLTEEDVRNIDRVVFKIFKPDDSNELIKDTKVEGNIAKFVYKVEKEGYYRVAGKIFFKNGDFTTSVSEYIFKAKDTFK